ncbi:MAG: putative 3-phenylpropionic acid transporter [Pseudomonadota bacterium]|jgi:PPP family 3-phenylpropionic acid transporter
MSPSQTAASPLRQLAPFALLNASYFAHIGFFNTYLPLWMKDLGYGLIAISLITAAQSATRLFAPYLWGWLSDHSGERVRLMRWCASVSLLASASLAFDAVTHQLIWLAVVMLLMFTHNSALVPLSETTMSHLVTRGGQFDARLYGRVRLCGSAGFLVTVVLAGWWFERDGLSSFVAWAWVSLAVVSASVWWMPDLREDHHANEAHPPLANVLRNPQVQLLLAAAFFHVLSHIGLYAFFSLYLDSLGYSKTAIGLLWAISVLAEIVWFSTQARWLPLLSLSGWVVLCSALTALRMGVTAQWGHVWWLLVAVQMLHAFTFATHHTANVALISHYFPGKLRGRGQALYTVVAYGSTGVLGSLLGGVLSEQYGLAAVFWMCAATAVVGALLAARLSRLIHH